MCEGTKRQVISLKMNARDCYAPYLCPFTLAGVVQGELNTWPVRMMEVLMKALVETSFFFHFLSTNLTYHRLTSHLDINVALRKLVCLLKPDKEIVHNGDHMIIRTLTSLRNYIMDFDLGVEFEEDLGPVDGRKCQVRDCWVESSRCLALREFPKTECLASGRRILSPELCWFSCP